MTVTDTVQAKPGTRFLSSTDAEREIRAAYAAGREVSDAAALTIAAWWQTPTGDGSAFASLCGFLPTQIDALTDAIVSAYREAVAPLDKLALDMLGTWALNHPSRKA